MPKKKGSEISESFLFMLSAEGGNRTHIHKVHDFESCASASSATSAQHLSYSISNSAASQEFILKKMTGNTKSVTIQWLLTRGWNRREPVPATDCQRKNQPFAASVRAFFCKKIASTSISPSAHPLFSSGGYRPASGPVPGSFI